MDLDEAKELESAYLLNLYAPIRMPMVIARGEGARLWDTEGNEYLDFVSGGRAVAGLGHCHPKVVRAVQEQAERLIHVSNDCYTEPQLRLGERLWELFGGRCFLCNSGAEAIEAAIKLARKRGLQLAGPEKHEIITVEKSFHGRTLGALAATGQPKYQQSFQPLPPGFTCLPFNDVDALRRAVNPNTCAIFLEPILGESGVYPASREYLAAARELSHANRAALVFDEVQTGMGRTGRMFAFQHHGIEPDAITLAKGLGGGVPIGALLAREPLAGAFEPGDHASTFGGGPLPAAAALAALDAIEEEGLVERAAAIGERLAQGLEDLREKTSLIGEVRARGCMVGVDLTRPAAGEVKSECIARGLLVITVGDSMLRLLPAMVLTDEQADRGLKLLGEALAAVEAR